MTEEQCNPPRPAGETIVIDATAAGQRLDVYLAALWQVSRSRVQKSLEGVTVNHAAAKPSLLLKPGDILTLPPPEAASSSSPPLLAASPVAPDAPAPTILFEDEHLIVLNKPRGLAVHPGAGERRATLVDILRAQGHPLSGVGPEERSGIVHRLDKETSGVMVVCKTDAAHWKLAADFAARTVRKTYIALVCGVPSPRGRIEAPIARHAVHRKKMAVVATGRPAITEYKVVRTWRKFAQLEINLMTGRTHQIRVHLAYIHHPVVGDATYGGQARALQSTTNVAVRAALEALPGQALHAWRLAITHPITGKEMAFESPLPAEIVTVIEALDAAD